MKNLEHLLVSYELSLKLKQKGFNEPCLAWYFLDAMAGDEIEWETTLNSGLSDEKNCTLPIYAQVVDWLEDVYLIKINAVAEFNHSDTNFKYNGYISGTIEFLDKSMSDMKTFCGFKNKKDAIIKAIEEALKLI